MYVYHYLLLFALMFAHTHIMHTHTHTHTHIHLQAELLQWFYETTLEALQDAKNDRLWFKTNTKVLTNNSVLFLFHVPCPSGCTCVYMYMHVYVDNFLLP